MKASQKAPLHVCVTGAAGNIGYALVFRLASGDCYGKDQPIVLHMLEIPTGMKALEGVAMELSDCAFPLLHGMVLTDDLNTGFDGVNQAFLVGSRPRTKDMNRADLIKANGPIFVGQGKAIAARAASDVRVIVVGNPCNTNALIAMHAAKGVSPDRFHAMTRLDENRAKAQIATKAGVLPGDVTNVGIWGNHSDTMYPDYVHAKIGGRPATEIIPEESWFQGDFLKTVATRGKAIIEARGASSAASAASAAIDHMAALSNGTPEGQFTSMGVCSDGQYGVPKGLIFSYPVAACNGEWKIVEGLEHGAFAQQKIAATTAELVSERETVADLLG
ncbi:MAG: malate dehydrogenase [Pseudomonadota bacterium]|nr:malate dehydrogenase [Pseudomonadota bacterium]